LTSCGVKNSNNISEKWPRMPATARVMPAKYVKVSPTKTLAGYQLKVSKAKVVAARGIMRYVENK
jgi:hypothetical protein